MGLFDKMKKFVGGKGMAAVEVLSVNDQDPGEVRVRISDEQVHGTMQITAQETCTILGTKVEVILRTQDDEGQWGDVIVSYAKDKQVQELEPGDSFVQPWAVAELEIARYLRNQSWDNVNEAVDHPRVKLVINCIADVKGSPFDPNAEVEVGLARQSPMALAITAIEGQQAEFACFPVADSVLKGTVEVTAHEAATLVATKYEIHLELEHEDGRVDVLAAQDQDPELEPNPLSVSFGGTYIEFPLRMKPGQKAVQTWMVSDIDLPAALAQQGFADASEAVLDPRVRLVVKCIADMEGMPSIASSRVPVQLSA